MVELSTKQENPKMNQGNTNSRFHICKWKSVIVVKEYGYSLPCWHGVVGLRCSGVYAGGLPF